MRKKALIPQGAYVAIIYLEDGTNVTDLLSREQESLCLRRTLSDADYVFDYLEAKSLVKSKYGAQATKVLLTKVQALISFNMVNMHEEA